MRSLLRAIYSSEADLIPDHEQGALTIRLHDLANRSYDEINTTETRFPRTDLIESWSCSYESRDQLL